MVWSRHQFWPQRYPQKTLQDNILALTGKDEDTITIPSALILPDYTLKTICHKVPNQEEFEVEHTRNTRTDMPNATAYWFRATDLSEEAAVSPAAPLPTFLVCIRFDMDIDPIIIYKRIHALPNHAEVLESTLALLMLFLFATVVKTTKKDQTTINIPDSVFLTQPTALANSCKKICLAQLFPIIGLGINLGCILAELKGDQVLSINLNMRATSRLV
jgi:hypothetical protein